MIDTRGKRASCLGLALTYTMHLPVADGTITAADRLHLTHLYSGFAASSQGGGVTTGGFGLGLGLGRL
jgi:hypothetical protein